jgi:hypothetical protein
MKRSVDRFTCQHHIGKASLITLLRLSISFIFPMCHRCEANGVTQIAGLSTLANWCMLEYIDFVETPDIISRCSLAAYYYLGFRHHVPSLYSAISLIKP